MKNKLKRYFDLIIIYNFLKHLDIYIRYDSYLNLKINNIFLKKEMKFTSSDLKLLLGSSGGNFLK